MNWSEKVGYGKPTKRLYRVSYKLSNGNRRTFERYGSYEDIKNIAIRLGGNEIEIIKITEDNEHNKSLHEMNARQTFQLPLL